MNNKFLLNVIFSSFVLFILNSIYLYLTNTNSFDFKKQFPFYIYSSIIVLYYFISSIILNYLFILLNYSLLNAFIFGIIVNFDNYSLNTKSNYKNKILNIIWGGILFASTVFITIKFDKLVHYKF